MAVVVLVVVVVGGVFMARCYGPVDRVQAEVALDRGLAGALVPATLSSPNETLYPASNTKTVLHLFPYISRYFFVTVPAALLSYYPPINFTPPCSHGSDQEGELCIPRYLSFLRRSKHAVERAVCAHRKSVSL